MNNFQLLSQPWWVNIFVFFPFVALFLWRRKLKLPHKVLAITAVFAITLGFVEASVVVYLRALLGLLGNETAGLFNFISQTQLVEQFPRRLLNIEMMREIATVVILISVTFLSVRGRPERWAIFLWMFSFWDIFYYIWLKILIGWPQNLTTPDVLFLIPVPWYSQVWYPLLVSALFISSVLVCRLPKK